LGLDLITSFIGTGPHYFFHWDWTSLLLSLGLDLITSLSRLLVDHCSTQWLNNQGIHLPKRCFSCAWLSSTFHQEKTSTQMTHPRDLTHHDHDHDDAADAEDDNDDYDVVWCSMYAWVMFPQASLFFVMGNWGLRGNYFPFYLGFTVATVAGLSIVERTSAYVGTCALFTAGCYFTDCSAPCKYFQGTGRVLG